jgi:hypothetical protein
VKPSERLQVLEQEELEQVVAAELGLKPKHLLAGMRALARYLDEQHELERRKRCLTQVWALLLVHHPSPLTAAESLLSAAGLTSRINVSDIQGSLERIKAEAEREGLF